LLQEGKGSGESIPECSSIATDCQVPKVQRTGSQDCQGYIIETMGIGEMAGYEKRQAMWAGWKE